MAQTHSLRQRIAVCDDDMDIVRTLVMILEHSYEVIPSMSGKLLVDHLEEIEPDLFILDAMMPEMSGYEVADAVRKNHRYKEIPIIMLSGLDSMRDHRTGYDHGVSIYLTKPFMPEILLKNVELELFKLGRPQKKKNSMDELEKKYRLYSALKH
jgi:DNA-binding response OmpR family regulator